MGYSITVDCVDLMSACLMAEFLEKNFPLSEPHPEYYQYNYFKSSWNMRYPKNQIGFDCIISGGDSGDIAISILRWVAIKIGKRKDFEKATKPFPYIIYDGLEDWPIYDASMIGVVRKENAWDICDERGFQRRIDSKFRKKLSRFMLNEMSAKTYNNKVSFLHSLLDQSWEKMKKEKRR